MAIAHRDSPSPPLAVSFDYGQRHRVELGSAAEVARHYGSEHLVVSLDTAAWGGSALTDASIPVPEGSDPGPSRGDAPADIPVTYVPARNTIFLAVALGVAEARDIDAVYIGVNALDYSGYPDCRPEFIDSFRKVATVGQKRGIEGRPVQIRTPLIDLTKAAIVKLGNELGAPMDLTWSCYREGPLPCGHCDACVLRARGFAAAGMTDPALSRAPA